MILLNIVFYFFIERYDYFTTLIVDGKHQIVPILDSERSKEASGFTIVFICFFLYTKFQPEGAL